MREHPDKVDAVLDCITHLTQAKEITAYDEIFNNNNVSKEERAMSKERMGITTNRLLSLTKVRYYTEGCIVSHILSNVIMDAAIWKWYADIMEDVTTLAADDSTAGSLDPEWQHNANQHLCNLFKFVLA